MTEVNDAAIAEIAGRMFDGDLVRQPQRVQDRVWRDARAALFAALAHLTDDGAAATPPADKGVWCAPAAESATPVGAGAAAPSSPHLSREAVMAHYHSQFCEYDGMEDGIDVCAGECREFAEGVGAGATPAIDREALTELLRFNRHAPYVSNERLADMVTEMIEGAS